MTTAFSGLTPEAAGALLQNLAPDRPARLGVITNPFSRTNARTRLYDQLLPRALNSPAESVMTRTAAELDDALVQLLVRRGANVIGLNGGDGTLHLGVNRLVALCQVASERLGTPVPMPRLLFLNGGTLNIVSRSTGTSSNPVRTVVDFRRRFEGKRLSELSTRELRLISVTEDVDGQQRRSQLGFVFGTEIVANAVEMYTLFGEGYGGLLQFLTEVFVGYTVGTRMWREHGWKLDPTGRPIRIDGHIFDVNLGAVATTIDLAIAKGALTAIAVPTHGEGFFAKVLLETHPGRIIRLIPSLMVGSGGAPSAVMDVPDARLLEAVGSYTLDGELFIDRTPEGARRRIRAEASPFRIAAVNMS